MEIPPDATHWIEWWLTNRSATPFHRSLLAPGKVLRQLRHLSRTKEYSWIGQSGLSSPSRWKRWLMSIYGTHASGAYFPILNTTKYRIRISQRTQHLRVHELTHALGLFKKQERQILVAFFKKGQWRHARHLYWDNPWEIYARLMEFRFRMHLMPEWQALPADVRYMRSSGDLKSANLHRYSDDFLLFLLNKIA